MINSIPDKLDNDDLLYHYTTEDKLTEHILKNNTLLLNLFVETNDPYEYNNWNYTMSAWGENTQIPYVRDKDTGTDYIKYGCKLMCFSIDSIKIISIYDKGFSKSRMWNQYGNNHNGFCLIFNKNKMITEAKKKFKDSSIIFIDEVKYENCNSIPRRVFSLEYDDFIRDKIEARNKHLNRYYKYIFYQKNCDYLDENEFRIVVVNEKNEKESIDISTSLEGIILGDKIQDTKVAELRKINTIPNITYYKMNWHNGVPSIKEIN